METKEGVCVRACVCVLRWGGGFRRKALRPCLNRGQAGYMRFMWGYYKCTSNLSVNEKEEVLIKENKLERNPYEGDMCALRSAVIPTAFPSAMTYSTHRKNTPTHTNCYKTCRYTNTHEVIHINRNTPALAHISCSQTLLLAGCDYIQERGNALRLRWEVLDGGDMSALALNFTQDCLPISPCPFLTLKGECAVGCWKCGAMAQWAECLGTTLFHLNTLPALPARNKYPAARRQARSLRHVSSRPFVSES